MKDHGLDRDPSTSPSRRHLALNALATAVILVLAGCGGGSSDTGMGVTSPTQSNNTPTTPIHRAITLDSPSGTAWTWVGGTDTTYSSGTYGTQGIAAPGNVPGARGLSVSWTDAAGNFWLFGGFSGRDFFNDLWEYNPTTNQWAWMGGAATADAAGVYGTQGTAAASNMPGARAEASVWQDAAGNVWLFGGQGFDTNGNQTLLNDLWEYSPSTGLWTWVSGSSTGYPVIVTERTGVTPLYGVYGTQGTAAAGNVPGARSSANLWTDSAGNVWLFGGDGFADAASGQNTDLLNDLWEYSPSTGLWTWVSGSDTFEAAGVYGTQGTAAASNVPGARNGATSWTDANGNLWLFAGFGNSTSSAGQGYLNDLWEFSPSTGLWTWVGGTNSVNSTGVYGAANTAAPGNVPSGREGAIGWADAAGDIWVFGGWGDDNYALGDQGDLSDLWEYSPATGQWAWVSGSNQFGAMGVYGTQGVAASTNLPGARIPAGSWVDASGNLWLFGGQGNAASGIGGTLNDLWVYRH